MLRSKPIICGSCKKDTGYTEEQFMFYVATSDILCPHCGAVIIHANNGIEFTTKVSTTTSAKQNPNIYTPPQSININVNLDDEESFL